MKRFQLLLFIFLLGAATQINAQSVLLVNDNGTNPERIDALKTSLDNIGQAYSYYDAVTNAASPTVSYLEPYDLVIWYTGNDSKDLYFWDGNDTTNTAVKAYLDQGGMLWLAGLDFLYDLYSAAPDTMQAGDFVYDYLGIASYDAQSHKDDGVFSDGVPFYEVEPGNGIFTLDSLNWYWATMWYADAVTPTANASVLYKHGPADYDLGGKAGAVFNEVGDAKIMSFTTDIAKLDAQWRLDTLMAQGIAYFAQFAASSTPVTSITVTSVGGQNAITEKGGSLTFEAAVLPDDATNKNVAWKLENNTAHASIDQNGVLTAAGLSFGNGTVTVVAEAADGSGVTGSMDITISNQGSADDYEILLVNDNANGATRYLELDTALIDGNYNHIVYNTITTGEFPDAAYLSNFDVVIWYTGNDGASLKLWDATDSTDFKFNAPLIQYMDNGGIVWLQGLDFFYDAFGQAPYPAGSDEIQPGKFIYDYMGVKKYVGQSKKDDGGVGVPQLDLTPGHDICELDPMTWTYSTMWYVDAMSITDDAVGVYNLGPSDYVFAPFYAAVYKEHNNSKLLTCTFESARLQSQDDLDTWFEEVLGYFETLVDVTEIDGLAKEIQVSPNPAKDYFTLSYNLTQASDVSISVFSIDGKQVYAQNLGKQATGQHSFDVLTENMTNGLYFCNFNVDGQQIAQKVIVSK
ncbi:MAG TPA: T9SS type A sorting domain-containing protein [Saprospiraceae bacterium]|nr:T9SS type A sorting domain-containing protein [Saprospiraceae bacterium]